MRIPRPSHFRHHGRFYLSILLGFAVGLLLWRLDAGVRITMAGSTFFFVYLASTAIFARSLTTKDLRTRSNVEDEGIGVIVIITLAAIALSIGSLTMSLAAEHRDSWQLFPAIANVPLGWATLHTIMAFHYAHLVYRPESGADDPTEAGGLEFPATQEPGILDFLYYSFVVGMTAQVSDVDTTSPQMRRVTLAHGVVSFFFNTVILAVAVNVLVSPG